MALESRPSLTSVGALSETAPPDLEIRSPKYCVKFAKTMAEVDRILELRYRVFNLELGEGLDTSHATRRDEDVFDRQCHHLMIVDLADDQVVGTYRMQTAAMARAGLGFYSAQEFDLSTLPAAVIEGSVEIGRACIAKDHRNGRVLHLLWRGLAGYLAWQSKERLFGCCSLTTQDPALGLSVHAHLLEIGAVHSHLRVAPHPDFRCEVAPDAGYPPPHLPALFRSYLSLGAKVLGSPAIDREFKTIDWLVLFDLADLHPTVRRALLQ